MHPESAKTWADRLESLAFSTLGPVDAAEQSADALAVHFADELGHSRPLDRPLILHALAMRNPVAPTPRVPGRSVKAPATRFDESNSDLRLWWALLDHSIDITPALTIAPDDAAVDSPRPAIHQPPNTIRTAIEVWTHTELAGLHALWWHAHFRNDASLHRRVRSSAAWLLEHIQPDNATNHPWAIHVFLIRSLELAAVAPPAAAEYRLFAETLLHNSLLGPGSQSTNTPARAAGHPDRLGAWVVLDAANALRFHDHALAGNRPDDRAIR
jgi:hypothetical protein